MTVIETVRADVRRRILESARALTDRGEREFSRSALHANMVHAPVAYVFVSEIANLRDSGQLFEVRPHAGARGALYSLTEPAGTDSDAPDWGLGYPSAGKMIGPAWRAIWALMADGRWHERWALGEAGAHAGGCLAKTAANLLHKAVAAGFIEVESRFDDEIKRWRMWYRRTDVEAVDG